MAAMDSEYKFHQQRGMLDTRIALEGRLKGDRDDWTWMQREAQDLVKTRSGSSCASNSPYLARGTPHLSNNMSTDLKSIIFGPEDNPGHWDTTSSVFSSSPFETPKLEVKKNDTCRPRTTHELTCPRLLSEGKTIHRVRRTRQVPWEADRVWNSGRRPKAGPGVLDKPMPDELVARQLMARRRKETGRNFQYKSRNAKQRFREQCTRISGAAAPLQVVSPGRSPSPELLPSMPFSARAPSRSATPSQAPEVQAPFSARAPPLRTSTPLSWARPRSQQSSVRSAREAGTQAWPLLAERKCETPIPEGRSLTPMLPERRCETPMRDKHVQLKSRCDTPLERSETPMSEAPIFWQDATAKHGQ